MHVITSGNSLLIQSKNFLELTSVALYIFVNDLMHFNATTVVALCHFHQTELLSLIGALN